MTIGYSAFEQQLDDAEASYPSLKRESGPQGCFLKGRLDIIDAAGKYWDTYEVEIHFQEGFPYRFPALYETGGKIPKKGDWHIYEDTLTCCVKVLPEEILRCINGITLVEYIKEEVLPYLFNQTHRRIEGYYVNGEYSHGAIGFYEFYSEALGTKGDIKKTVALMKYIADHSRPDRTSKCFCGSSAKFRHCHRPAFDKLKKIGDNILLSHAYYIAQGAGLVK